MIKDIKVQTLRYEIKEFKDLIITNYKNLPNSQNYSEANWIIYTSWSFNSKIADYFKDYFKNNTKHFKTKKELIYNLNQFLNYYQLNSVSSKDFILKEITYKYKGLAVRHVKKKNSHYWNIAYSYNYANLDNLNYFSKLKFLFLTANFFKEEQYNTCQEAVKKADEFLDFKVIKDYKIFYKALILNIKETLSISATYIYQFIFIIIGATCILGLIFGLSYLLRLIF